MIDLKELEDILDKALDKETKESIQKFLDENHSNSEDNRSFSQRDFEQIINCLENPPEPTDYLIESMRKYKESNIQGKIE